MEKYTDPHFSRSVLITIDTQNDFTLTDAPARIEGTAEAVPNMSRLLESFRKNGLPVLHVIRLYQRDGSNVDLCRKQVIEAGKVIVAPESDGAELVDGLRPDNSAKLDADLLLSGKIQQIGHNEFVMYKPRWGAFYGTSLEKFLKQREIDTVVISGCNYPNCPRTTIYEASERDFRVVLVRDAISQLYQKGEEEMQNIGVNIMETDNIENILSW
jgi:nicotinamidase-related amidase